MNCQSGQAIAETLIVFPILILGGALMVVGAHIIAQKSELAAMAAERAQILSASELQWGSWDNVKQTHWALESTPNLRFYATQVTAPVPGISVQINACVRALGVEKSNSKSLSLSESPSRTCLGMFETASTLSLLRAGVVRIRVSAFAPRHLSHALFHRGLSYSSEGNL
jgi:hypothetical protein